MLFLKKIISVYLSPIRQSRIGFGCVEQGGKKKLSMQKQKPTYNYLLGTKRLTLGIQKDIGCQSKKIKTTPIGSIAMRLLIGTKKRLSPITLFLLISLRPRPLRSVKKVGEDVI